MRKREKEEMEGGEGERKKQASKPDFIVAPSHRINTPATDYFRLLTPVSSQHP